MVAPFVCEVMRKVVMLLQCWSLTALIGGAEEQVESVLRPKCHMRMLSSRKTLLWEVSSCFCHSEMLEFARIICSPAQVTNLKKQTNNRGAF